METFVALKDEPGDAFWKHAELQENCPGLKRKVIKTFVRAVNQFEDLTINLMKYINFGLNP